MLEGAYEGGEGEGGELRGVRRQQVGQRGQEVLGGVQPGGQQRGGGFEELGVGGGEQQQQKHVEYI